MFLQRPPLLDVVSVGMAAARARLEVLGPAIPFAQAVDCCDCQAPTSSRTSANRLAGAYREPSASDIARTLVGRARMARSLAWTMVSECGGLVSVRAGRLGVSIITAVLRQRDRDGNFNVVVHAIPEVWSVGYC